MREASAPLLTVSAVVLSKNGSGRLQRCLESIQRTGFADEIVVCVDSATTDDTFRIARRFTPNVHVVKTEGNIESVLSVLTDLCSCDFVLRIDDDEALSGNWDKESFQLLATYNSVTEFWVPTRWLAPPGDVFIASGPWFPDPHPRLYVNDPSRILWPGNVHEHLRVPGRSFSLYDRWIDHFNLIDRPRGERRRRCAQYRELNPSHNPVHYLFEEHEYCLLPCSATAIEAAHIKGKGAISAYKPYIPDEVIDFSASGTAVDYMGRGWGEREPWGTWTVGNSADFSLPLESPLAGGAIVTFEVMPYLNSAHPSLDAALRYRNTVVAKWTFDTPGQVSLTAEIPSDIISGDSKPSLQFYVTNPRSPLESGESADPRLLGLGFRSLRFRPSGSAIEGTKAHAPNDEAVSGTRGRVAGSKRSAVERAVEAGRKALPGLTIDVHWEGMWIFRVDGYSFPMPDISNPEEAPWKEIAGFASRYLKDAQDYWYYLYHPKPGDVVIDVGAGRGEDTLAFSLSVGSLGKVIAMEPHPVSFAALNKFCTWNRLANVTALNVACVSEPKALQIETLPNWQSNYVTDADATPTSFPVDGTTLDLLLLEHNVDQVHLLKMNIEGAEREALPGARTALERVQNVCIAAHDFRADRGESESFRTGEFVREFLRDSGFKITTREDPRPWARWHIHGTR